MQSDAPTVTEYLAGLPDDRRTALTAVRKVIRSRLPKGIVEAIISSATALEPTDVEALRERLTVMTGKRVELHQEVDASLLGGVSVRIGDRLIDGSVRGRLERLRTGLSNIAT